MCSYVYVENLQIIKKSNSQKLELHHNGPSQCKKLDII